MVLHYFLRLDRRWSILVAKIVAGFSYISIFFRWLKLRFSSVFVVRFSFCRSRILFLSPLSNTDISHQFQSAFLGVHALTTTLIRCDELVKISRLRSQSPDSLSIRPYQGVGRGKGRKKKKGLTQRHWFAQVQHQESGCCADWPKDNKTPTWGIPEVKFPAHGFSDAIFNSQWSELVGPLFQELPVKIVIGKERKGAMLKRWKERSDVEAVSFLSLLCFVSRGDES